MRRYPRRAHATKSKRWHAPTLRPDRKTSRFKPPTPLRTFAGQVPLLTACRLFNNGVGTPGSNFDLLDPGGYRPVASSNYGVPGPTGTNWLANSAA